MAAQFVFFYLTALFLAASKPTAAAWILAVYVFCVIRSMFSSR